MKAEEIGKELAMEAKDALGATTAGQVRLMLSEYTNRLRSAGLLLEWRTDLEDAPDFEDVLLTVDEVINGEVVDHMNIVAHWSPDNEDFQNHRGMISGQCLVPRAWSHFQHVSRAIIKPPEQTTD